MSALWSGEGRAGGGGGLQRTGTAVAGRGEEAGGSGGAVVLGRGEGFAAVAVLKDGRLASGGSNEVIKLWPKEGTGEPVVLAHGGSVSLTVLGDGRLASGGQDGKVKLW